MAALVESQRNTLEHLGGEHGSASHSVALLNGLRYIVPQHHGVEAVKDERIASATRIVGDGLTNPSDDCLVDVGLEDEDGAVNPVLCLSHHLVSHP